MRHLCNLATRITITGVAVLLLAVTPALAQPLPGAACPTTLGSCTANDVVTTLVGSSIRNNDTCADGFLDISLTLNYDAHASTRYDLGLFVGTNGDPRLATTSCVGSAGTIPPFSNQDSDACGDIKSGAPVNWTIDTTVACPTAGGPLTVQACRVWDVNTNNVCSGLAQAVNGSKCDCSPIVVADIDPCQFLNCDDGNSCTNDSCFAGACVNTPNNNACDDGNACTTGDTCSAGSCAGGAPLVCNDGNVCTDDSCNPASGCVTTNNTAPCNDGNACTTADTCAAGSCVGGAPLVCNDGDVCTDDSCNPASGCVTTNNTAPCDDGNACTTADTCAAGTCVGGAPLVCNDGDVCTDDSCDPASGCVTTNNTAPCDDGDACTTGDTCSGGSCGGGSAPACDDGNVCTNDSCDPATGCTYTNNTNPCDDSNECTTADTCSGGSCVGGPPLNCSDGDICTDDVCDPATGCSNPYNTAPCDDGEFCTVNDVCTSGTCVGGGERDCSGDACNVGVCNEVDNRCDLTPTNEGGSCGDDTDNNCTDPDTCDAFGFCQPNNEPCGSVTNSALCQFDTSTKGVCVDQSFQPTGNVCDITGALQCPSGETCFDENQFRLLFTPAADALPGFKLDASNPGQFYYNLVSDSPGCDPGGGTTETFDIKIPYPFVTQGARPVHVYDGELVGNAVGDDCFTPPEEALASLSFSMTTDDYWDGANDGAENLFLNCNPNVSGLDQMGQEFCTFKVTAAYPPSCQLYINVHLDYGLKGKWTDANPRDGGYDRYDRGGVASFWNTYNALKHNDANIAISDCRDHPFSHKEEGTSVVFSDNIQNLNDFAKVPPGVFGRVFDSDAGTGQAGLTVKLLDQHGTEVASAVTDDDGFYFIPYKHKGKEAPYEIEVQGFPGDHGEIHLKGGNAIVEANFDVFTTTWSYD